MARIFRSLTSSQSEKKEPRYTFLSEAKASHAHRMWTEVISSVPHFLQVGLLLNPIIYRCLLNVLCPVRRPVTALDCVLLKDSNRVFVAGLGPEINSQACLLVLRGIHHHAKCWLSAQHFIFLFMLCLETPPRIVQVPQTLNKTVFCDLVGEKQWLCYILSPDNCCIFCWCCMERSLSLSSCQAQARVKATPEC
jgi:hypothetical protein